MNLYQKALEAKAALKLMLQNKQERKPGPIRVGFLCQYIPAWNKAEAVYREMQKDHNFQPFLLCVPSAIKDCQLVDPEDTENDTYDYYVNHGYEAVNTLVGKNTFLDLTTLDLDYVFYLRPYNYLLPPAYTSSAVSAYAKVCLLLYGMNLSQEMRDISLERSFMRHVYCYYAENQSAADYGRDCFPLTHKLGIRRSVFLGMPAMKEVLDQKDAPCDAWDFSPNRLRIMWTPRWTKDPELGGTNFFQYKDWILDYAESHPNMSFLLRPHPLTFPHFVETGDMTQEEVDAYKARCNALPNAKLDTLKEYLPTMWHSTALIGDASGIIPEYFLMNKPLIFCISNYFLHPTEFTYRMLDGCYLVENQQQLESCLTMLQKGRDPLEKQRTAIIQELFGDTVSTSAANILQDLRDHIR